MILLILCTAHFLATVAGLGTSNTWIFPTSQDFNHAHVDGSYAVGTTMNLEWTTIWESVNLVVWQDGPLTFQYLPNSVGLVNTTSFIWTVNLSGTGGNPSFNLSAGETFFFGLFETGSGSGFESQYVNFTSDTPVSPISSSAVSSSASSTLRSSSTSASLSSLLPTTSTVTLPAGSSTAIPSASASSQSAIGMSTATKTGIGVGVGIGFLALIAGFGIGYWVYGRRKASPSPPNMAPATQVSELAQPPLKVSGRTSETANQVYEL